VNGEKGAQGFEKKYEIGGRSAVIQAYPCFSDMKGPKPVGTALILLNRNKGDLNSIEPLAQEYKKVPIKFVLYDGAEEDSDFENSWAAKGLIKSTPEKVVEDLIKENNEMVKLIANVFKGFDKDHSGFIELKEIGALAKEMGVVMSPEEAAQIMKEMDINKDGRISMEEFVEWWKSGRQGRTHSMNDVISEFVKQNELLSSAKDAFAKFASAEEWKEEELKLTKSNFGIFINRPKSTGLLLEVALMTPGKQLSSEFQLFSSAVGLGPNEPFFGIALGCKNPKNAGETLKGIIDNVLMMATAMIPNGEQYASFVDHKIGEIGNKVVLTFSPSALAKPMVDGVMAMANIVKGILIPEQVIQFYLGFAADLKKVATESKPIYEILMEGALAEIKCQISRKLHERLLQFIKDPKIKESMPKGVRKVFGNMLGAFQWLEGVKGELEFEMDQELKDMISQYGAATPFAIPVKDLKAMQGEMLKPMITQMPLADMAYNLFKDEVTSIEFFVYGANLTAIKLSLDLPGLGELINLN
jgi:hypothetical protein